MPIRISGLNSQLDTDAIVKELISAYSLKKQKYEKGKTSLEWKKDTWKDLNTKILKLYNGAARDMKFSAAYSKKTTSCSNANKATVTAGSGVANGTQTLEIEELAATGYLTGGKLAKSTGEKVAGSDTLASLGYTGGNGSISLTTGGTTKNIEVTGTTTITEFVNKLKDAGVSANFDTANQRIFVLSKESGLENDFALTGSNTDGISALSSMGLYVASDANNEQFEALKKYAQYTGGTYDPTLTKNELTRLLTDFEARKTQNATLKEDNNDYADANINLADLRRYAMANMGATDTLDGSSLTAAEKTDVKTYMSMTDAELEADPVAKQKLADLKTASGITEDDWAELKSNINTVNKYESEAATNGNAQNVIDVNAAVAGGSAAFNTYIDGVDADITANNDAITANNTIIADNLKEIAKHSTITGESGTIAEQVTTLEEKIKNALSALNGDYNDMYNTDASRINGKNAVIHLNDARYESSSNTITVNGLTVTALQKTAVGEKLTINTNTDVQGMYDSIKNFITEYNTVIKEMEKLYNASSAKGYEPLTDEEKEAMSDKEVEKWEQKIKDSLLRRDDTLSSVMSTMTSAMSKSITIDGENYSLSSFGIKTMGYFASADNEKNVYHIDGDKDDSSSSDGTNRLMDAIQNNPEAVEQFFTQLSTGLYDAMSDKMKGSTIKTMYNVYNDKQMDNELKEYQKMIDKWDDKLEYYEEFYYNKFTAMEVALSKLQSSTNSLTSLMGG